MIRIFLPIILLGSATYSLPMSFAGKIPSYFSKSQTLTQASTRQLLEQRQKFIILQKLEKNTDFNCTQTDCPKFGSWSAVQNSLTKSAQNIYSGAHMGLSMGANALVYGTLATTKLLFGAILGARDIYNGALPFIKQSYKNIADAKTFAGNALTSRFEQFHREQQTQKSINHLDAAIISKIRKL